LIDTWTDHLTGMEELVLRRPNEELWTRMCGLRGNVMALQRTLRHFRESVAQLLVYEGPLVAKDNQPYYRDLHDHLLELVDALEGLREITGELMQTFHARQSQKTNDIMQVLTIITTIFVPLTFVAGIYGMNFDTEASVLNMPELKWAFGYPACLMLMVLIALAELWFFWKRGWIFQSRGFGQLAGHPMKPEPPPAQLPSKTS
jgi:magnesium transporter